MSEMEGVSASGTSGLATNTKSSATSANQRLKSPSAVRANIDRTAFTFSSDIARQYLAGIAAVQTAASRPKQASFQH
jgi:hypothetical protein